MQSFNKSFNTNNFAYESTVKKEKTRPFPEMKKSGQ